MKRSLKVVRSRLNHRGYKNPSDDMLSLARRVIFIDRVEKIKEDRIKKNQDKSMRAKQEAADREFNRQTTIVPKSRVVPVVK